MPAAIHYPAAPQPVAVPSMANAAAGEALARTQKSAREFEAMAIGQLLQPMFATVDTRHSLFGGGDGEESWKPMLVNEMAKKIAEGGGLGLARPILAEMLRMQEAREASRNPRNGMTPP